MHIITTNHPIRARGLPGNGLGISAYGTLVVDAGTARGNNGDVVGNRPTHSFVGKNFRKCPYDTVDIHKRYVVVDTATSQEMLHQFDLRMLKSTCNFLMDMLKFEAAHDHSVRGRAV